MKWRGVAVIASLVLSLLAIISLGWHGLNFAVDFTGGTVIEVKYADAPDLNEIRSNLEEVGFTSPTVQNFGTTRDVLIRLAPLDKESGEVGNALREKVVEALNKNPAFKPEIHRMEFVGPQVGDELVEGSVIALIASAFFIVLYVAWRFEYRFALGAILATLHDITMILGFFSLLQLDFDLTVFAAVLTIMGYSLNDTIVVFDRVRENFRKIRRADSLDVINISINETLGRTLMTSFLTFMTAVAKAIWGGDVLRNFGLALVVGIFVGTYSSIYVATALAYKLGISRADMLEPEKEGATDVRP
jgi:preprotein translocase subunit SecF